MLMNAPRPKLQVMKLTEAAAARIKTLMADPEKPLSALRIGVKNGGCAGMEYTVQAVGVPNPLDELVEDKGVRIYVDQKAVLFLLGTEMDYKTDTLSSSFVFNNPNQTGACGCGESVSLKPAELSS